MEGVCEAVESSLQDWIANKFATHIVRRLLCLLSGIDALSFINGSDSKHVRPLYLQSEATLSLRRQIHV